MGRPRKPIPGWDDEEVERWLRVNRGGAVDCVAFCLPHLEGAQRTQATMRCRRLIKRMEAEGLDFSKPKTNLVSLPRPKPRPKVAPTAPAPTPQHITPPATPPLPPAAPSAVRVSEMSRSQHLAWTLDRAAEAVLNHDGRGSIAPTLKYLNDAHAELDAVRRKEGVEGLTVERLREIWPKLLPGMPNDMLDDALAEYLNRNPKQTIAMKKRATG